MVDRAIRPGRAAGPEVQRVAPPARHRVQVRRFITTCHGENKLSSSVFFLPNGHAPILAPALEENTSGTADALDDLEDTAYESTGFLYEVGFRWLVNQIQIEFG